MDRLVGWLEKQELFSPTDAISLRLTLRESLQSKRARRSSRGSSSGRKYSRIGNRDYDYPTPSGVNAP